MCALFDDNTMGVRLMCTLAAVDASGVRLNGVTASLRHRDADRATLYNVNDWVILVFLPPVLDKRPVLHARVLIRGADKEIASIAHEVFESGRHLCMPLKPNSKNRYLSGIGLSTY